MTKVHNRGCERQQTKGMDLYQGPVNFFLVGPTSRLLWVGRHAWKVPVRAQMEQKLNMKMGPKIDFEPTSVREPWHEESIGHVFFQFRTKIRCQPPSHTSFPRQKSAKKRFFLGDVFVFCLDFFDMLNGSSRCKAICAPFFSTSVLKNWLR